MFKYVNINLINVVYSVPKFDLTKIIIFSECKKRKFSGNLQKLHAESDEAIL